MSDEHSNSTGRQFSKPAPPPLDPGRRWFHGAVEKPADEFGGPENDYDYRSGPEMTAATGIDPDQKEDNLDPQQKRRYEKLHRYNDFRHENDRANDDLPERQHAWDMQRIPQAITSQLPISERQRGQIVETVQHLDFSTFGPQRGVERVTLGVAAVLVMDEREKQFNKSDRTVDELPEEFWLPRTDEFRHIQKAHDVSMSDLNTIKGIIREQLDGRIHDSPHIGPFRDPHLPKMTAADRPDEYWEEKYSHHWHLLARHWEHHSDEYEEALPERWLELTERLRHWEPWNMDYPTWGLGEETTESTEQEEPPEREGAIDVELDDVGISPPGDETLEDELDALEEAVEAELSDESNAEAERLLDEMPAQDGE